MKNSIVSVIIPSYNHATYIEECVISVINQDYKFIELIIIDDGSTDRSVDRINQLLEVCKKRFLRFKFHARENRGLAQTLNEGLEWCRGEYLQCLASDDIILPHKTSCLVDHLEKNMDCIGVYGDVNHILSNGLVVSKGVRKNKRYKFRDISLHYHYLPAPAQLLRMEKIRSINGFNTKFLIEDWSMCLGLTINGGAIDYIGNIVSLYRHHESNISKNNKKMHYGRLAIVNHYAEFLDYKKTLSITFIIHASEISSTSFGESMGYYFKAITMAPQLFFSKFSLRYLASLVSSYFVNLYKKYFI
jgi:alpha-1,3-rhamnosyltransferase